MSVRPETVELVEGWLIPAALEQVDRVAALDLLRRLRVLGAVQSDAAGENEPVDVVLAVDGRERVLLVDDEQLVPGPRLSEFGPELCRALGVGMETLTHTFEDPHALPIIEDSDTEDSDDSDEGCVDCACGEEDAPGDVLVSRVVPSELPFLAHWVDSPLSHGHVDGWTLVQFEEPWTDLGENAFLTRELPAALLRGSAGDRSVEVLAARGLFPGIELRRLPDRTPTFDRNIVDHPIVEALSNPHLQPDSELLELLASPWFSEVEAATAAAALQTTVDAGWSARVLTALGFPPLAADVHEGRRSLAEVSSYAPERVEVSGVLSAMVASVVSYYDAPAEEVARRGVCGRLYARVTENPALLAAWVAGETALAAYLLDRAVDRGHRPGVRGLLALGGATLLADAGVGVALTIRRRLRRGVAG
jgi:hypothetical protein